MVTGDLIFRSILVVGDTCAGKSPIIHAFLYNQYLDIYDPTIEERYQATIDHGDLSMNIQLCEVSGLPEYAAPRYLCYAGQDLILLVFSVVDKDLAMDGVIRRWAPEIHRYCGDAIPILLVGSKIDLRSAHTSHNYLTTEEGVQLAKTIGAQAYLECSAKTHQGVQEVFQAVAETLIMAPNNSAYQQDVKMLHSTKEQQGNPVPRSPFSFTRGKLGLNQRFGLNFLSTGMDKGKRRRSAFRKSLPPSEPVTSLERITGGPVIIGAEMSMDEVLKHLGDHGCKDITEMLNLAESSQYPISTGGFGDVYRGYLRNGARVSIKCLRLPDIHSPEKCRKDLKHAARELYVWSKCRHQNILELNGVAIYRNQLAMISPWMENGNVIHFLSQNPRFDRHLLCIKIATGVLYLHGEKIAHGDIKGANILIADDFSPKLADFGNSTPILGNHTLQFTKTTSGPGMSPRWTPPEILEERTGFTLAGDIYSLAMTFLEIISGSVPYAGIGDFAAMSKAVQKIHPDRPLKQIPSNNPQADSLWALLTDCWVYDPHHRPMAARVVEVMLKIFETERTSSEQES